MKVYLKELYTVVPIIGPGNNPCVIYFAVLQYLLNLYVKEGSATDADLLQIPATVLPIYKGKNRNNNKLVVQNILYVTLQNLTEYSTE